MPIARVAIHAVVTLLWVGCSSPSGDDTTDAGNLDDGSCSAAPQPPSPVGECQAWRCTEVAAPTCWECAMEAAHEGDPCTEGTGGVCSGGACGEVDDPGEPGPIASSTQSSHEVVIGDDTLPITVYRPDGAGPFPVIVFSHGFTLSPSLYQSYGEHLASWGYLVVMPALPGSLIAPRSHAELAEILLGLVDWIEDNASLADGPLGGVADPAHLAFAGHSMGGKVSLLASTQDDRPLAVFGVDPVDAGDPSVTPELISSITIPLALLGETTNGSGGIGQPCAPAEDNFQQYYQYAISPAVEIEMVGANHMSFLDNPNCGLACSVCPAGTDDTTTTRRLTRRYMTAFFNLFVREESAYQQFLAGDAIAQDVANGLVLTQNKNGF